MQSSRDIGIYQNKGDVPIMLKKLFGLLPFVHHQPPLGMPLRKVVILATQRPVEIKKMERLITQKLKKNEADTIKKIENGIEYLRRERFFKRDSSNLFVAGLRAISSQNAGLGLEFGEKYIHEIPDIRAIKSMVLYYDDIEKHEEKLFLLNHIKDINYANELKSETLGKLHPGIESEGIPIQTGPPWTFSLTNALKLNKKPQYFKHRFRTKQLEKIEGMSPEFKLIGKIKISKHGSPSSALVQFQFFDENNSRLIPATIPGLTHSNSVGWYSYLRQDNDTGDFMISFELPENCVQLNIGFQTWNAKSSVKLLPGFEVKPSSTNQFQIDFTRFMANVEHSKAEELVFMFSGTTYVQDVRANRPIRLTRELMKRGIPVIFNYHRWRRTDDHPEYSGDLLFQIPIDVTKQFMAKLATLRTSKKKIFIVSYPHPIIPKILNRFKVNGWANLYDARDDWEEFEKVGQAKWYSSATEKYIVTNCDHITAVSWPLANKLDAYEPIDKVHVVPNALSPNFLSNDYKWIGSKRTKVGYFGHLTASWFDWDSLIEIANQRPEYLFEIIGHSAPDDLNLPKNIDLMGPKTHPEINKIAAEWSVAIIPFKTGLLADAVDPIKIYEYMALDLPTVSFRMPQIDKYPYTITVENNEEFCFALDESVRYRPKRGVLKKWLARNKWGDRVDDLLSLAAQPRNDGISNLGAEE